MIQWHFSWEFSGIDQENHRYHGDIHIECMVIYGINIIYRIILAGKSQIEVSTGFDPSKILAMWLIPPTGFFSMGLDEVNATTILEFT